MKTILATLSKILPFYLLLLALLAPAQAAGGYSQADYDAIRAHVKRTPTITRQSLDIAKTTWYYFIDGTTKKPDTACNAFREKYPKEFAALTQRAVVGPVAAFVAPILRQTLPPPTQFTGNGVIDIVRSSGGDFPQELVTQHFRALVMTFSTAVLPALPLDRCYEMDDKNQMNVRVLAQFDPSFHITAYGPDPAGRFGFITHDRLTAGESAARAIGGSGLKRKKWPSYGIDMDHGHKIDLEHIPHQLHDANVDPDNYNPCAPTCNQQIRRILTQLMGFHAYGEIPHYDIFNPRSTIVQVPNGFIFKAFQGTTLRIYYLPNESTIYQTRYEKKGGYKAIIPLFEVKQAAHLFFPLVYNPRDPLSALQLQRYFYIGMNLYRHTHNPLNEVFGLLRNLKLPLSWNGVRGATPEEEPDIRQGRFRKRFPDWNDLRLPTGIQEGKAVGWEDADASLIPVVPTVLDQAHKARLLRNLYSRLFAEAAKHPASPLFVKLAVARVYTEQKDFQRAHEVFRLAHQQLQSFDDTLLFAKQYLDYLISSGYLGDVHTIATLLEGKLASATVEGRFSLELFRKKFRQKTGGLLALQSGLDRVTTLGPHNSRLLKEGMLTPKSVAKLVQIIGHMGPLTEVTLQNVMFCVAPEDCCFVQELADADWITEHCTPEEFFWVHDKPLQRIFHAIQRHSGSLRRINLGLTYFLYHETGVHHFLENRLPEVLAREFPGFIDLLNIAA